MVRFYEDTERDIETVQDIASLNSETGICSPIGVVLVTGYRAHSTN